MATEGMHRVCLRAIAAMALTASMAACATSPRTLYTAEQASRASVPGIPDARVPADASIEAIAAFAAKPGNKPGSFAYLALSGGGGDGAYGAGVLNGWSASGTRPEFNMVSGVSTGALIAPFAFLGPSYDTYLAEFYTSGLAETLVRSPDIVSVVFGSGLFGEGRLRDLIGHYVTSDLLSAVAAEHAKGRRLLIVTTNLDTQRATIWNMGAIACSGMPNARDLFTDVLAASASIPAVFSPQLVDVAAGDARFQEMHVDGSVVTPVFTLPQTLLLRDGKIRARGRADIYVILNGRLEPSFEVSPDGTLPIVARTLATASRARARVALTATYALARSSGIGFNLTYIDGAAPTVPVAKGFDTTYMRALYRDGYDKARAGRFWEHDVPAAPTVRRAIAEMSRTPDGDGISPR